MTITSWKLLASFQTLNANCFKQAISFPAVKPHIPFAQGLGVRLQSYELLIKIGNSAEIFLFLEDCQLIGFLLSCLHIPTELALHVDN